MAIADTITSMQTHTSNAYDIIGYGTDLTGINKNLENLKQTIFDALINSMSDTNNITWNNLPKITGSGTLNNTAKAPMENIYSPSELSQDTTTGKNLLNTGSSTVVNVYKDINISLVAGSYIINCTNITTSGSGTQFMIQLHYTDNTNNYFNFYSSSKKTTLTASKEVDFIRLYADNGYQASQGITTTFTNLMVRNASIISDDYEPYTGGIPAPNPSYPQTIHSVSGSNTITIKNKNIFNDTMVQGTILSSTGGTAADNRRIRSSNYTNVNADTYTFSTSNDSNLNINVFVYDENENYISSESVSTFPNLPYTKTFTSPRKIKICIAYRDNSNITPSDVSNIQIEKNSSKTTYTPHQEQNLIIPLGNIEYCKIGNYEDRIFETSGKNLLNETYYNNTSLWSKEGSYYAFVELPNTFKTQFYVNMSLKGTSQSLVLGFTDTISGTLSGGTKVMNNGTITSNVSCNFTNAEHVYLAIGNGSQITIANDIPRIFDNYNIIVSTTSNEPYEPYGTGQWYIKKNIGKVVLDGTEEWGDFNYTSGDDNFRVQKTTALPNILTPPSNPPVLLCNYFVAVNRDNAYLKSVVGIAQYGLALGTIFISAPANILSEVTLNGWNTWLRTHNLIVYYLLATPTYELLSNDLQNALNKTIYSYDGQTNISQTPNDLPFVINSTALQKL